MTATSPGELRQAQLSGAAIGLAVRPRGGVTQTFSEVVVTEVTDDEVTVADEVGVVRTFALEELVDVDAEARQRRRLRGVDRLFDVLGLTR